MQKSAKKLDRNTKKEIFKMLYQVIADLKNPQEVEIFLGDILGEVERLNLAKRLAVALFLEKKRTYEKIKNTLKVSSATIAEIERKMEKEGIQLALEKIKTEEWADKWSEKISKFLGKIFPRK